MSHVVLINAPSDNLLARKPFPNDTYHIVCVCVSPHVAPFNSYRVSADATRGGGAAASRLPSFFSFSPCVYSLCVVIVGRESIPSSDGVIILQQRLHRSISSHDAARPCTVRSSKS